MIKRKIIKILILGSISIVFTLTLVETYFTLFNKQPNLFIYTNSINGEYIYNKANFDDYMTISSKKVKMKLNSFKDSYTVYSINLPHSIHVKTDINGFRSDYNVKTIKNKYRMLFLGDSITFGYPLEHKDTFVEMLRNKNREVINAGIILNSTPRIFKFYKKKGVLFNSDLVIVQLTTSRDNFTADYLYLDKYEQYFISNILSSTKISDTSYATLALQPSKYKHKHNISLNSNTTKRDKINKILNKGNSFLYASLYSYRFIKNLFLFRKAPLDTLMTPYVMPNDTKIPDNTKKYLSKLNNLIRSNNSKMLVIIVPNKVGCYGHTDKNWNKVISHLRQNKINFIDFRSQFCSSGHIKHNPKYYFKNDIHPNKSANIVIKNRIQKMIKGMNRK